MAARVERASKRCIVFHRVFHLSTLSHDQEPEKKERRTLEHSAFFVEMQVRLFWKRLTSPLCCRLCEVWHHHLRSTSRPAAVGPMGDVREHGNRMRCITRGAFIVEVGRRTSMAGDALWGAETNPFSAS